MTGGARGTAVTGVSPGRRDEIFTLFARRADDAGAGLGLTIAKTFIEAHGQRIWVEDAPGGGARFCFMLPVAQASQRSGSLSRILIVDDDPDLLSACTVGLTALGHQVWTAQTGAEGLDQAAIRVPEVIVLDLGLPDLDGLAVCRRIRTWSDVPIVVLSADGSEDRKVDTLDQGADDYMTKPFGLRELNARLKVALRHHQPPADSQPPELDVGALHLDLVHYEASLRGRPLDLTPREFDFLAYLARNAGKVCTRRMILENVWGPGYVTELHYLKVYAYRIRRKLGAETGQMLQSDPRGRIPARGSRRLRHAA